MDIRKYYSAYLSEIAYQDEETIKIKLETIGFKFIKFFDFEGMQAYLCECKDGQVLVFRQTELNWNDWKRNFDIGLIDTYIGEVQKGYFGILNKYKKEIIEYILDSDILVTGFSQGGALAIIFEKILQKESYNSLYIAFDPPKVSSDKNFNNNGFIVVKGNSIVSRFPFSFMGYRRTGKIFYITSLCNVIYMPKKMLEAIDFVVDTVKDAKKAMIGDVRLDHNIEDIKNIWQNNFKKIKKRF